jgi:hypothetical protein
MCGPYVNTARFVFFVRVSSIRIPFDQYAQLVCRPVCPIRMQYLRYAQPVCQPKKIKCKRKFIHMCY